MTGDPDVYLAVEDGPEVELRVKGSRFVGRALAAGDESAAEAAIGRVRRRYHGATHHCWAWRLGPPEATRERFDDDGEPSGTAGRPILAALAGRGLHEGIVIVTRYFGGTKLGAGGLARAYGNAAALALEASPGHEVVRVQELAVACPFEDLGLVEGELARSANDIVKVEREFEPSPRMVLRVRRSRARRLAAALVDATAGRAVVVTGSGSD